MADAQFSIVWQPCVGQTPVGNPLPYQVSFPFFIEGAEHHALAAGSVVELGARELLFGILLGYDEAQPFAVAASKSQMIDELRGLAAVAGQPPLEVMLLNATAYLREKYGSTGHVALKTAMDVMPNSAMIKSDYLMSTWGLIHRDDNANVVPLLEEFAEIFPRVDLALVDARIAELLVSAELHVLTWLNRRVERDQIAKGPAAIFVRSEDVAKGIAVLLGS
jgi:hypothetical protein